MKDKVARNYPDYDSRALEVPIMQDPRTTRQEGPAYILDLGPDTAPMPIHYPYPIPRTGTYAIYADSTQKKPLRVQVVSGVDVWADGIRCLLVCYFDHVDRLQKLVPRNALIPFSESYVPVPIPRPSYASRISFTLVFACRWLSCFW